MIVASFLGRVEQLCHFIRQSDLELNSAGLREGWPAPEREKGARERGRCRGGRSLYLHSLWDDSDGQSELWELLAAGKYRLSR